MDAKSTARLKDQARTHEQREEWDEAISRYLQVLNSASDEELVTELPLYNRVGDLYLRTGRPNDAVRYYEQAADRYAEAGLFNNAIALCNKALRYAPHRVDLLRKLGRFSASQGFLTDARRWFLEYAERALHKGEVDDAFRALDDFADISDDPEIRELLARKLYAHGRLDDALAEYQRAYAMRLRDGASTAADALRDEVLQRYPQLTELEAAQPQHRRTDRFGKAEALPELGDQPDEPDTPAPPEGLPGLDSDEPETAVEDPGHVSGFEQTSLVGPGTMDEPEPPPPPPTARRNVPPGWEPEPYAPEPVTHETHEPEPAQNGYSPADSYATADAGHAPTDNGHAPTDNGHAGAAEGGYVDLSDLLGVAEEQKRETRFFVQETNPTGDEDRDFAELLAQFKEKLKESLSHDDIGSHYDLGLAFKEMGLLDEAISEFQIALRAGDDRLKIFEELGQCFLLKRQYNIAVKVLSRALQFEPDDEIELIGVYYHLGRAYEELGHRERAMDAYERVVGLDINFQDVSDRMARL